MAGLKQPGYRYNTEPVKPVEGFQKAISPRKTQPGQTLTLQRSEPVPPFVRVSGPPACFDSSGKMRPDGLDSGLDTRKMALWAAFHHAAAGGAPEAPHEQGIEVSVEKSTCKSMPPYMTLKAAGTYFGLLPGIFFPKKL